MGLLGQLMGRTPRVALYVDGPNLFREEFEVDLPALRAVAEDRGQVIAARCYFDVGATPGLLRAAEAHGFEIVITSGDVDVRLAVDATAAIADGAADVLVIASRDMDFKPVLETARQRDIRTVAVAPGSHGRSDALSAVADESVTLDE